MQKQLIRPQRQRMFQQEIAANIRIMNYKNIPTGKHIVFGFSHTFGPGTFMAAHCIRFFAHI
ncbi:hypothetical protein QW71_10480 [Paenibacillus sp. IHB B 3415]|nr:hypothetical protein QW71_10480 [Paenibacillus sp. IHB B 3415]